MQIILFLSGIVIVLCMKSYPFYSKKPLLGYREYLPLHKGQNGEFMSSLFCSLIWIFIFIYDYLKGIITLVNSDFSSLFLGGMCGISIATIYTIKLMPKGFYEKGILTETKAISYKNINRVSFQNTKDKNIIKTEFHTKEGKALTLFIHQMDKEKVMQVIKKHKLKS